MSDQPEDQSGTADEVAAPQSTWPEAEEAPTWADIADQAESSAPGPAGPGASPQGTLATGESATEAGRSRRPASLRDEHVPDGGTAPRQTLSAPTSPGAAPASPGAAPAAGPQVAPPVSGPSKPGNSGQVPRTPRVHLPNPAALLGKLPTGKLPTDRISKDSLPLEKLSTDRLPVDKLRTLTKQRPEVGLGLAFAGGLVIATILKRLARR